MIRRFRAFLHFLVLAVFVTATVAGAADSVENSACDTAVAGHQVHVAPGVQPHPSMPDTGAFDGCAIHEAQCCMQATCSADLCDMPRLDITLSIPRTLDLHAVGEFALASPAADGLQRPPRA